MDRSLDQPKFAGECVHESVNRLNGAALKGDRLGDLITAVLATS
ncbi:hypothetical protein [Streptomyces sp. NPDC059744]